MNDNPFAGFASKFNDDDEKLPAMDNPRATHVDFTDQQNTVPTNPHWRPTNIDAGVHRHKSALFQEWKHETERLKAGQCGLYRFLASEANKVVLVIIGDAPTGRADEIYQLSGDGSMRLIGRGKEKLRFILRQFHDWAEIGTLSIKFKTVE